MLNDGIIHHLALFRTTHHQRQRLKARGERKPLKLKRSSPEWCYEKSSAQKRDADTQPIVPVSTALLLRWHFAHLPLAVCVRKSLYSQARWFLAQGLAFHTLLLKSL